MNRMGKKTAGAFLAAVLALLAALGTEGTAAAATAVGAHSTAVGAVTDANTDSYAGTTVQQAIDLATAATKTQLGSARSVTLTTLGADQLSPPEINAVLAGNTVGGVKPLFTDSYPKPTDTFGGYAAQAGVPAEATDSIIVTSSGNIIVAAHGKIIVIIFIGPIVVIVVIRY